jgi:hypothetical protein
MAYINDIFNLSQIKESILSYATQIMALKKLEEIRMKRSLS